MAGLPPPPAQRIPWSNDQRVKKVLPDDAIDNALSSGSYKPIAGRRPLPSERGSERVVIVVDLPGKNNGNNTLDSSR